MQGILIHKVIFYQSFDQHTAAIGQDIFSRLLLQIANCLDYIATDDGGISPGICRFQGSGHDIFAHPIHHVAKGIPGRQRVEGGSMLTLILPGYGLWVKHDANLNGRFTMSSA